MRSALLFLKRFPLLIAHYAHQSRRSAVKGKKAGWESKKVTAPPSARGTTCTRDYSSADGEHGFRVTEARWTPDSRFFVYSTSSSGGHQPYHSPTYFYSRRTNRVRDIEQLTPRMVVDQAPDSEFKIVPPHSVALVTSDNGLDNQETTLIDLYSGVVSRRSK